MLVKDVNHQSNSVLHNNENQLCIFYAAYIDGGNVPVYTVLRLAWQHEMCTSTHVTSFDRPIRKEEKKHYKDCQT